MGKGHLWVKPSLFRATICLLRREASQLQPLAADEAVAAAQLGRVLLGSPGRTKWAV